MGLIKGGRWVWEVDWIGFGLNSEMDREMGSVLRGREEGMLSGRVSGCCGWDMDWDEMGFCWVMGLNLCLD